MTNEELVARLKKGEVDFSELLAKNEGLLFGQLNKWYGLKGWEREDLNSELMMVMYESALSFDETKGAQFHTHVANNMNFKMLKLYRESKQKCNGSETTIISSDDDMTVDDVRKYNQQMTINESPLVNLCIEEVNEVVEKVLSAQSQLKQDFVREFLYTDSTTREIATKYDTYPTFVLNVVKRVLVKVQAELRMLNLA